MEAQNHRSASAADQPFGLAWYFWLITHFYLFFSRHPLAKMPRDAIVTITVVADGNENEVNLTARRDEKLHNSVISRDKAATTKGVIKATPPSLQLQDSDGNVYHTNSSILLRYNSLGSHRTFPEEFYIVEKCEHDALLRRDIATDTSNGEPGCYPFFHKTPKPDVIPAQRAKKDHKAKENEEEVARQRQNQINHQNEVDEKKKADKQK